MHHNVIDAETFAIENRPNYPPEPVGVAIKPLRGRSEYLAWNHPTENNCTKIMARRKLLQIWDKAPLLFHNAAFDIEVLIEHLDLPIPKQWDDTLLLAYLYDARAKSLSLKPMAEQYLDMPPDEQTKLRDWIIENYMKPNGLRKFSQWGKYIAYAPGNLVGRYAKGDVIRTARLYDFFYPKIREAGMEKAYIREKKMIGIKLDMEQPGIRLAPKLVRDHAKFVKARDGAEKMILKNLKAPKDFNLNSPKQLAEILIKRNKLDKIVRTAKGAISTRRQVLEENCNDPNLIQLLGIHGILDTYIGTFIEPWIRSYKANDGRIYPSFNTIRSTNEYGRGGVGTRTGRFSSSNPNFQNVPSNVEESQHREILLAMQRLLADYGLRFIGLRDYIVPEVDHVLIARDYSQQELRILAHYEDDELLNQYVRNPELDIHSYITDMIVQQTGIRYERKHIKITVFGILYGMGIDKLAHRLNLTDEDARKLRQAIFNAVPGMGWLTKELKKCAKNDDPIYTWGGRRYYKEPSKWIKDPRTGEEFKRDFGYKLLNLLIQGSAADATKQGMININDNCDKNYFQMLVQVHDEVLAQVPKSQVEKQNKLMKEAMEDLDFDVKMLTEAKIGATSWARLK